MKKITVRLNKVTANAIYKEETVAECTMTLNLTKKISSTTLEQAIRKVFKDTHSKFGIEVLDFNVVSSEET